MSQLSGSSPVLTRPEEAAESEHALPATTRPVSPRPGRSRSRWLGGELRQVQAVAGVVLFVVLLLRSPADEFLYDAGQYFDGARAVLDGGSVFDAGGLDLRGVLTAFLYLPAALVAHVGGDSLAGAAVLAQNSVLLALLGVVVLPRLVAIWRPVSPPVVLASAVGTAVTLAGFAPFPLTDLWAATLMLVAVVALDRRAPLALVTAGLAAGAAINIRPATLLPVAAVGLAVLVARRWSAGWVALGGLFALLPQFLLNRWRGAGWLPVPERTGWLTELQAYYGSHVVRYDTVVADPDAISPSRYWCSPQMLQVYDGQLPESPGELAGAYLTHLPQAIVFGAQKIGAALHWPLSTPYTTPATGVNAVFAGLITVVVVVGAAVLLRRTLGRGRAVTLGQTAAVLAWTAALVGLTTSATETRFALPLVLFGVAGCTLLAGDGFRRPRSTAARLWVGGTLILALATYGVGLTGMQHARDDGAASAVCIVED